MNFQSATSILDFKLCPMLFFLRHVLRIRPIEKPDAARQGTHWHKCLEILTMTPGSCCPNCEASNPPICEPDCVICEGEDVVPEDLRSALIRYMNDAYKDCPPSISLTDWETERTILLYSAIGWQWHWQNDQVETVASEVPFSREINSMVTRRGRIDRIVRRNGSLMLGEYKSTGKPIDPGAFYWNHLKLDSQLTLYLIEARHAQLAGELESYGISADDPLISGMLYDVWHKPGIRAKKLSQADSKKFIADNEYFGEKFEVATAIDKIGDMRINGVTPGVTLGKTPKPTKKNPEPATPFAIRETPEMFGARLLDDIRKQPERYFARKDIPRTDQDLARSDKEFDNIARVTNLMTHRDLWFMNEHQCNAVYRCSFAPICMFNQDVSNGQVPEGFKCLDKDKDNANEETPVKST